MQKVASSYSRLNQLIGGNQDALDCIKGMKCGNITNVATTVLIMPKLESMGIYGDNLGKFWVDFCKKDYCLMAFLVNRCTADLILGACKGSKYLIGLLKLYQDAYSN